MDSDPPRVFAFGSLMYEPEAPAHLVDRIPARLPGAARAMDKISVPRGCAADLAALPAADGFAHDGWHRSLALGLSLGVDREVHGVIQAYDPAAWPAVLAALDRREGYDASRDDTLNGYRRERHLLRTDRGPMTAWVYVSNPDSVWSGHALPRDARAHVLAAATPRVPTDYARGADYVLRTLHTLDRAGVHDPDLDALLGPLRQLLGDRLDRA